MKHFISVCISAPPHELLGHPSQLIFIWFQSGILTNWSWAKAKEGRRGKAGWGTKKCCMEAADTAWRNTTTTTSRGQEENGIQECNSRPEVRIMTDDFFSVKATLVML